jgi:hypothetical protein
MKTSNSDPNRPSYSYAGLSDAVLKDHETRIVVSVLACRTNPATLTKLTKLHRRQVGLQYAKFIESAFGRLKRE